ncbi:MAG TPA: hypothetical protein VGM10_06305 [Actinocrinis sp.]|jgi:hypothetical protein
MVDTPAENEREQIRPRATETSALPAPRRAEWPVPDVMGRPGGGAAADVMGSREPIPEAVFGERSPDDRAAHPS